MTGKLMSDFDTYLIRVDSEENLHRSHEAYCAECHSRRYGVIEPPDIYALEMPDLQTSSSSSRDLRHQDGGCRSHQGSESSVEELYQVFESLWPLKEDRPKPSRVESWNSGHKETISPRSLIWPTPPLDPSPVTKRRWSTNWSSLDSAVFTPRSSIDGPPRTSSCSSISEYDILEEVDLSSIGDVESPPRRSSDISSSGESPGRSSDSSSIGDVESPRRSSDISSYSGSFSSLTAFECRTYSGSERSWVDSSSSPQRGPGKACSRSLSLNDSHTSDSTDDITHRKSKKRSVSFNDEFGMPLTTIRVLADTEDHAVFCPGSPTSEYNTPQAHLLLKFPQPASDSEAFINKVIQCRVSLENILTEGTEILGTIRVLNIAFEKRVFVRYTINGWESYTDVTTTHVPRPDGGLTNNLYDSFSFGISVAPTTGDIQFAICYLTADQVFWDNNDGQNYGLQCVVVDPQPPLAEADLDTQQSHLADELQSNDSSCAA